MTRHLNRTFVTLANGGRDFAPARSRRRKVWPQAAGAFDRLAHQYADRNTPAEEVKAQAYNAAIVAVAKKHPAAGENLSTLDVHAVITAAADKYDNPHPNDAGDDTIANVWHAAFAQ